MNSDWGTWLVRWSEAGLIDPATAERIRAFEQARAGQTRLRWPIRVALAFGGLMVAGGVLLFIAAHWDGLSPSQRFVLVLLLVGGFHVAGAFMADRFHGLAVTFHTLGTVSLGAGIALAGQIFNLDEHWPGGVMMWALGAAIGWVLLRHTPQMALTAVLAPAWLVSEWIVATDGASDRTSVRIVASGVFLLALTYFTAPGPGRISHERRALVWLGGIALLPASPLLTSVTSSADWFGSARALPSMMLYALGWAAAFGLPLGLAAALRRAEAWPNALAALWILVLLTLRAAVGTIALYAWWALGAIGLVAWGVREGRTERINMGAAIFAATVLAFYFSEVMDKLGRSASLIGLGLLFLGGGWALERMRRRLVGQARGAA